jgi:hypothetical protein
MLARRETIHGRDERERPIRLVAMGLAEFTMKTRHVGRFDGIRPALAERWQYVLAQQEAIIERRAPLLLRVRMFCEKPLGKLADRHSWSGGVGTLCNSGQEFAGKIAGLLGGNGADAAELFPPLLAALGRYLTT